MKKEIVISGFGGQGGLAIGKNLAEAGMAEGLNVTWAPSYGPEMRGGTANCSVVLSDKPVGSPVFNHPTELIAMDLLKHHTIYGADITKTSSIAKMNMILAGDGHNNIIRQDSLANPVDDAYDIVITNMPFAQKTRYGDKYAIPSRNGDIICPQHCWRAVKPGGRMAIIVPDGFLTTCNNSSFIKIREFLLKNATLKSVVSLPRGSFEPYNRVKASILYFKDIKKATPYKSFWYFNVKNDGFTLDKKRKRIAGPNDLEQVLSENDLENQPEDYRLSLGIDTVKISDVLKNNSVLISAPYRVISSTKTLPRGMVMLKDILEPSPTERISTEKAPIMRSKVS